MELAFTVTKLGPLSQIAVPIVGIDKLVYLAYHAYGWYKSPEQALTLEQTLASNGSSLAATSAFNLTRYCNVRRDQGGISGAVQSIDGSLTRILLPKASTATEGSPGLICLRALVVGLLCFVRPPQITSVLKEVLPHYLSNHELEGDIIELQGACIAALSQYVITISREEDVDSLPGRLQDHVDSQLKRVTDATLFELQSSQKVDVAQVIGLLRWILTPLHSRQSSVYFTKSAKVWALALVLSEVGFEIEARRKAIRATYSTDRHDAAMQADYRDVPEVILVLSPGWPTDIGACAPMAGDNAEIRPPPRVIPIRAVPAVGFSELVLQVPHLDAASLETAFFETFAHVQRCLKSRPWFCLAAGLQDRLEPVQHDQSVEWCLGTQQRRLLIRYISSGDWEMMRLLSPMVKLHAACDQDLPKECLHILIQHIILAGIYAVVTLFVHQGGTGSDSAVDVNIMYDALFSIDINDCTWPQQKWAQSLDEELRDMTALFEPDKWSHHFACAFAPSDEKALRSRRQLTHELLCRRWAKDIAEILIGATPTPKTSIFGAQNHGLALISSFALQPWTAPSAPFTYHMQRGQLLDIPTKEGLVIAGLRETPLTCKRRILENPYRIRAIQDLDEKPAEIDTLRWDLDPCWETDVQTCCINLRVGGLPVLQLSLDALLRSVEDAYPYRATCSLATSEVDPSCQNSHPKDEVAHCTHLLYSREWYRIPLLDMIRQGQLGITGIEGEFSNETGQPSWVVNAHGSEILTMLALNMTFTQELKPEYRIVADCLPAGLEKAEALGYPGKSVMIVLGAGRED